LSETLREVIADELAKIDDDRLGFVTITSVDVDSEMNRGIVFYDSMQGAEGDEQILEALNDHRKRLQSVSSFALTMLFGLLNALMKFCVKMKFAAKNFLVTRSLRVNSRGEA